MNKLKQIVYEHRLNSVKKSLRENAEKIKELFERKANYLKYYNEQSRLMSCNSYLENKLSGIQNAD